MVVFEKQDSYYWKVLSFFRGFEENINKGEGKNMPLLTAN